MKSLLTICCFCVSSVCFGAGRDIEFNVNDLYGNPWVETTIVGGNGPYNVWAEWGFNNEVPVINHQAFYVGEETGSIFVKDTFSGITKSVSMPFPVQPSYEINFPTAVPEPNSIMLTILSLIGIKWVSKKK